MQMPQSTDEYYIDQDLRGPDQMLDLWSTYLKANIKVSKISDSNWQKISSFR
jgi:hypothetical protein